MKHLRLSKDLTLPLDAITQTFLVVGKRGSGKSNTAARFVEQIHRAGLPIVVLDPTDTWWGLKAGISGGRGLDVYVFGGRKQDLPLDAGSGVLIAEVLCEHRISMVLSVKHLSGRERSGFMVKFAQTLFQKWGGGPLHVVLEEAHELAPQMGGRATRDDDGEAAMLGAFKRLWKLGRSSGIGGTAVTQRPASLSKDITTQSEILIAHRTIGPQDVKAIGEWVKYHGEQLGILGELPTLPTGEAFVWAPEFPEGQPIGLKRTAILLRETYDSASTPKVGEARVEPKELAAVDLERLRAKMASTIEKAKADDPKALRAEIAGLRKELASKHPAAAPVPTGKRVDVPILTDADRALLEKLAAALNDRAAGARQTISVADAKLAQQVQDAAADYLNVVRKVGMDAALNVEQALERAGLQKILGKLSTVTPAQPAPSTRKLPVYVPPAPVQKRTAAPVNGHGDVSVSPARQKILNGLAFLHGIDVAPADKTQLALIVGVSPTSGGYFNNLGALRSTGLIEYPSGGTVALTEAGHAVASTDGVPSTTDELHEAIRGKLPPAKWRILEVLIQAYPKPRAKDDLAVEIGVSPTSGGYFNNLGSLRSLGLVAYPTGGMVAATPVLFLEGA